MTSALPPLMPTFSFLNPESFFSSSSSSYPPQPQPSSTATTSASTSYALSSPLSSFNFNTNPSNHPFFASPSTGLVGGWGETTTSGQSSAFSPLLQITNDHDYLYTEADGQSISDLNSDQGAASPPMTLTEHEHEHEHLPQSRTTSSSTSTEFSLPIPTSTSSNNKRKSSSSSTTKKKTKTNKSKKEQEEEEDELLELEGDEGRGGGGGKRRGSGASGGGGGGSEVGSGDGGRGTTLAEVLAEQGITQEVYNGLPSARKRQLRNKVSARAFRARRKDYIDTLEGQLAEKDVKVESQRAEIARLKNENQLLRTQLRHSNNDH